MNQSLKWKKLDFVEYGVNYSINLETSEIRNDKTGKILKLCLTNGYCYVNLCLDGKRKSYRVHMLVYIAHFGEYDKSVYVIDHIDHDRSNNSITNLRLVTPHVNSVNMSQYRGLTFEYKTELPDAITINVEYGIYYCKQYDKFYRKVINGQFRELREYKRGNKNNYRIMCSSNNKKYEFTTTHFRETLQ